MEAQVWKLKHADLLYDYIKFHIGLYIATPTALSVLANALDVAKTPSFRHGLFVMLVLYLGAGAHASWTVASRINAQWFGLSSWLAFGETAHTLRRRLIHHYVYWLGLAVGLIGLAGVLP